MIFQLKLDCSGDFTFGVNMASMICDKCFDDQDKRLDLENIGSNSHNPLQVSTEPYEKCFGERLGTAAQFSNTICQLHVDVQNSN